MNELDYPADLYPWLHSQWSFLFSQLKSNRLPHATGFSGALGLGMLELSLLFSKSIFCHNKVSGGCESCSACHWFSQGSHPDFYHLAPLDGRDAVSIDQVRQMIASIAQTSGCGVGQVVLIESVCTMQLPALNALLKVLEEPPGAVYFILLCHQRQLLLPTVVSRLQWLNFLPALGLPVENWVRSNYDVDSPDLLLRWSGGSPLLIPSYLSANLVSNRTLLLDTLLALQKGQQTYLSAGKLFKELDESLILLMHQLLVVDGYYILNHVDSEQWYFSDSVDAVKQLFSSISSRRLYALSEKLNEQAAYHNLPQRLNRDIMHDCLMSSWEDFFKKKLLI